MESLLDIFDEEDDIVLLREILAAIEKGSECADVASNECAFRFSLLHEVTTGPDV